MIFMWSINDLPGIGRKLAERIVRELGNGKEVEAKEAIQENPYELMRVDGIGFGKADTIALDFFEINENSPQRHRAANRHLIQTEGVMTEQKLEHGREELGLENIPEVKDIGLDKDLDVYWLPEELEAEMNLASWISEARGETKFAELSSVQKEICADMGLDEQQTNAVRAGLANKVLCLTGGAGTGKTYIVAALAKCLTVEDKSLHGMALAGKAADRMAESFGKLGVKSPASTIHRALGYRGKKFTEDYIGESQVVLDECSMIPNLLVWDVVKRMDAESRLIMVGDPNQLPPIGYGSPFECAIQAGVPHLHLEKNYRQKDQQGILKLAESILGKGKPPKNDPCIQWQMDEPKASEKIAELVESVKGEDFDRWQIISPKNEDVSVMNLAAQEVINPSGVPLTSYAMWAFGVNASGRPKQEAEIREGDKILITKNSTKMGIFNGQTGTALGTVMVVPEGKKRKKAHIRVQIAGQMKPVDIIKDDAGLYLQLGYAITVHKSQGSDWDSVFYVQSKYLRRDNGRALVYTALTRAKKLISVVSPLNGPRWWNNALSVPDPAKPSLLKRIEELDQQEGEPETERTAEEWLY